MPEITPPIAAKDLLARLPRTCGPAFNEQLRGWDLLFPAEQRQLKGQFEWLARLAPEDFKQLFAPIVEIESRMELPAWNATTSGMTVRDVGILARSPLYPQWRIEVEKLFARIDSGVAESAPREQPTTMLVCVLPTGIPLTNEPLWPDLEKQGTWVKLTAPFGRMFSPFAAAVAKRRLDDGIEDVESTWVLECDTRLSPLMESTPAVVLSWTAMAETRRAFLNRLNTISRDLKSVDRTHDDLKRLDISRLLGPTVGGKPHIREFARGVLLSGNGSLVFNNSFVQWGASEALRRVQPQVLVASFGIRPKLKPFSSSVLFEDQSRSNPVADEDDPAGSFVDAVMLARYVYLSAQRVGYERRSLTLMATCDLDRVLLIGAAAPPSGPLAAEDLSTFALNWLKGNPGQ